MIGTLVFALYSLAGRCPQYLRLAELVWKGLKKKGTHRGPQVYLASRLFPHHCQKVTLVLSEVLWQFSVQALESPLAASFKPDWCQKEKYMRLLRGTVPGVMGQSEGKYFCIILVFLKFVSNVFVCVFWFILHLCFKHLNFPGIVTTIMPKVIFK